MSLIFTRDGEGDPFLVLKAVLLAVDFTGPFLVVNPAYAGNYLVVSAVSSF